MSIVAFTYAREGVQLFDESICKYGDCGTTISELTTFLARDIYRCDSYENSTAPIDMTSLIECSEEIEKDKFGDIQALTQDVKDRIESVFKLFGAYTPKQLGEELCDFISCNGVILDNGDINLIKVYELTKFDFESQKITPSSSYAVVNFLLSNNF